jgi:hypothetical protein
MTPLTFSPASSTDVKTLGPAAERLPMRVKALSARVGDDLVGVAGIGYLGAGRVFAFAHLSEECRKRKIQLHRQAKRFLADAERAGARVITAVADPNIPGACRWLDALGFKPTDVKGIYMREAIRG